MRLTTRYAVLSTIATLAFLAACSASGGADEFTEVNPTQPAPGDGAEDEDAGNRSALPPPSGNTSSSSSSGGTQQDGGKSDGSTKDGSTKDGSSTDSGPPTLNPGDACPAVDAIVKRTCGFCGTEEAVCLADTSSPTGGKLSTYGDCLGQIANGCMPGDTKSESCGKCGTVTKTCNNYCAWTGTQCLNEPANACSPGIYEFTNAGCPANTYRTHMCTNTCTWTNYPTNCGELDFELVVPATVGEVVSGIFPFRSNMTSKRLTGTCVAAGGGGSLSTSVTSYVYVELLNPSDKAITVSAWNEKGPAGTIYDTVMAAYAGGVRPVTDDERKLCIKGTQDACPSGLPCTNSFAGLSGSQAVPIAAHSSALIYFATWSSAVTGDIKLAVRTDTVQ